MAVRIDQCLYGYNDGHRLLAASRKLPEDAGSLLLVHSDVVAGASLDEYGYWSGMPVPAARCYALMRTWPAPEMPRPGCVWTHVLLIAFADVARFADMETLTRLVVRPVHPAASIEFGRPMIVDPALPNARTLGPAAASDALQILRAVYSAQPASVLPARGRDRESALFAVWSQQWPRLRRSFSFQTSGLSSAAASRFNLRLVSDADCIATDDGVGQLHDWERASLDDLRTPGDFRRFIWRYGSDIRRGRERFRFLAGLFDLTRRSELGGKTLDRVLDDVVRTLPDADDGKLLKTNLFSTGDSNFSLLPPSDPLDVLGYVLRTETNALPPPNLSSLGKADALWPARADQVLTVVEQALRVNSPISHELVGSIAANLDGDTFAALSKSHQIARAALAGANPRLLDSPGIEEIPQPELSLLLDLLPNDADLAGRVLDRLIVLDDEAVAKTFADRFPSLTAVRMFDAVVRQLAGSGPNVPNKWMAAIGPTLRSMLPERMLARIETTTALAACAILLDLDASAGLSSPPRDWASALSRARDDVTGQSRQRLMAYLLALALARPSPGCEPLFERAFEQVHADIAISGLPSDAFNALARYLPNLYWWQKWDTCLRLRTAVAEAYAENDLDPRSFERLTRDARLFNEMVDRAADAKHGRRFIKRLGAG